ncbi:hypothetical protein QR680_000650 [Steinernema hermaphroditum]|uniref:VWFD domain-containing protein n=1 Tax=Steinernema hermaphroditum TaxID=289476 RepID=A0AA39LEG3_9BILA|nr:hypothetical protein QR680_000650 [Steinernema hermaphroditum]
MKWAVLLPAVLVGVISAQSCDDRLITDDETGKTYTAGQLLGAVKALNSKSSECVCTICDVIKPCNNGTCVPDRSDPKQYSCVCPSDTTYPHCETCKPGSCGANADCFVCENQLTCVCKPGYIGNPRTGCHQKFRESCAHGDPHYITFDSTYYDYQGTCPYIYSKTCRQPSSAANYTIKARNKLYSRTSKVSYVSEIEVEMHGIVLHVDELLNLYIVVETRGGKVYIENSDHVQITFAREHFCVRVPEIDDFSGKGALCGFAGDMDGNCFNDIVSRSGDVLTNDQCSYGTDAATLEKLSKYLDTWKTSEFLGFCPSCDKDCKDGSIISPEIPKCDTSKTAFECEPIRQALSGVGPFAACKRLGEKEIRKLYESCVYDACYVPGAKCSFFKTFVDKCQQYLGNVPLPKWRSETNCQMSCRQIDPFSTYSSCMPFCQATCAHPEVPGRCDKPCIEGCICDKGYVLDTTENPAKCIKRESCGCVDSNGNIHPKGFSWLSHNCTENSACADGKIHTQSYKCPANSSCGVVDYQMECVCDSGYKWDANKKNCVRKTALIMSSEKQIVLEVPPAQDRKYNRRTGRQVEKEPEQPKEPVRAPSVEPIEPVGLHSKEAFESFYSFVQDQLKNLSPRQQSKARREILLVAERHYTKILSSEKERQLKKMKKHEQRPT